MQSLFELLIAQAFKHICIMLSEAELRKILREMRINVSDVKKGDTASLTELLARSLAKLQGLRAHLKPERALDPASMPRWLVTVHQLRSLPRQALSIRSASQRHGSCSAAT